MKVYVLQLAPGCTCLVLQSKGLRIMVDCGLDASLLLRGGALALPRLSLLDLVSINAVLLSNYSSFAALPYITEKSAFRGCVLATEPTATLGQQYLCSLEEQARLKFGTAFMYSQFDVLRSCERIQRISFGQAVTVVEDGLCSVTASPSGFCLGASNWTLSLSGRSLFVLCDCSIGGSRHSLPIDATPLLGAHAVLVASALGHDCGAGRLNDLVAQVHSTLNTNNGSVLLPMAFTGPFLDLVELLSHSSGVPCYVVAGRGLLMTASVSAEYLSQHKRERAYSADSPFRWSVRFIDPSDGVGVAAVAREKCIVFAEHSSLRYGWATELLQLMCNDARNAVVLTDPRFEPSAVLSGMRLKMRTLYIPLDICATAEQVAAWLAARSAAPPDDGSSALQRDPEKPPQFAPARGFRVVAPLHVAKHIPNCVPLDAVCCSFKLDELCGSYSAGRLSAAQAQQLRMTRLGSQNVLVAPNLSCALPRDSTVALVPKQPGASTGTLFGTVEAAAFVNALSRMYGITAVEYFTLSDAESVLVLPTLDDASVLLGSHRTVITSNNARHRQMLAAALQSLLTHVQ